MAIAGSLIYDTQLDSKGFKNGLNEVKTSTIAIGNIMADVFQNVASGLLDTAKNSIKLASDLQEVQNVVDTTFGSDASKINEWSKNAQTAFGMSELSAKKFNGTMGAMLKSMGLSQDEVYNMSTAMTGLAGDFASFYNLDHEEAFEKIRSGISGETEPLKQLGINMSVANLEAYALSQGITTAYGSMTQAEQATLRYNYLMSVTKDAQGDFAKTSDSFANQQRILELNFENLSATIGSMLLPFLNDLLKSINDIFTSAKDVGIWMEEHEQVLTVLGILIGTLTTAIIAYNVAMNATAIATTIATTASTAFGAVMAFITSPITLVVLAIGALIAIGYLLITNWDTVKTTALNVFNWIVDFFKSVASKIGDAFEGIYDIGKNIVEGLWNGITNAKNWLLNKVKSFATSIIDGMKSALGIHSPSTKFRDLVGRFIPQGIAVGIEADTSKAIKAVNEMDKSLIDEMNKSVLLNKNGISVSGVNGTVNQILSASARQDIVIQSNLELDGEKVYENQQKVSAKKNLQYAFA